VFLKSLTLKGFKSFADTTELIFEPGVTVVVGPNGSGKSNVVDAIAWVLGAQAPSAVRSQKMDDVIFAGTQKRQALGRAEVSLCIDNSSGILPVDFSEVTVTRTLWRTGESEYALNGVPCRLLDIQEILSDSGVGRQQHVIVSQGQIDAVLNARPEDRRAIIEEAAGVLKFRRRKEKAERRLASTEDNLQRVQDLLREVRRQLKPLERQAEAARRHGDLVAELLTLQLHLTGRQLAELRTRLRTTHQTRDELTTVEREVRAGLARLDTEVLAAEAQMAAVGATDLGDRLARVEGRRERARGLHALLGERLNGLERQLLAAVDQGVVETLEAEGARLRTDLADVEHEAAGLAPDAAEVEEAEAAMFEQRTLFEQEWEGGLETPSGEAARLRGELAAVGAAITQAERDRARLAERLERATGAAGGHAEHASRVDAELAAAADALEHRRAELAAAEAAQDEAAAAQDEAQAARHAADADRQAWTARADALSLALDDARARSGAEQLAAVEGALGTLAELIEIDAGWEDAVAAAAGDAIAAVVVTDPAAARRAVEALQAGSAAGAVLALGATTCPAPTVVAASGLRSHVRSAVAGVDQLLDHLVGAAVVVGEWREGVDLALRHPGALVVTRAGDRFSPQGWRIGGAGAAATAAALEEAITAAAGARERLDHARREVEHAAATLSAAKQRRSELWRQVEGARTKVETLQQSRQRIDGDQRAAASDRDGVARQLAELDDRLAAERNRQARLLAQLPSLEADEQEIVERNRTLAEQRQRLDQAAAALGARRTELEVRAAQVEQRRQYLTARLAEIDDRLARFARERDEAADRRVHLERRHRLAGFLRTVVADCAALVDAELGVLRDERQRQSDQAREVTQRLDTLRSERGAAERRLTECRERATRAEIEQGEITVKLETLVEALRRDLDCEPGVAMATECPPLPDGIPAAARVRELERELRLMGPVNPLALEEFAALNERCEFLEGQLEDVRTSRRELLKVIRAIDNEIVTVFAAAYADVADNFAALFAMLFPGGTGALRLTNPDDLLDTGIEVEAKPSGKNVKKLSLLSGGERSLTALAFLFAVFRSRPSPFYVMDEVEAALDDVNLHRFLQLVSEFREEAQLIIVSHQKRTMEAADCLYGVSMQPGGSSKVLSEKATNIRDDDIVLA
jgi:chromosome segregation protein